jgi:hypothetical protein
MLMPNRSQRFVVTSVVTPLTTNKVNDVMQLSAVVTFTTIVPLYNKNRFIVRHSQRGTLRGKVTTARRHLIRRALGRSHTLTTKVTNFLAARPTGVGRNRYGYRQEQNALAAAALGTRLSLAIERINV